MSESYGPDDTISKLDKIKMFAQLLVRSMNEEDFLSIITFGTNSDVVFPLSRMTDDDKASSEAGIWVSLHGRGYHTQFKLRTHRNKFGCLMWLSSPISELVVSMGHLIIHLTIESAFTMKVTTIGIVIRRFSFMCDQDEYPNTKFLLGNSTYI